MAPPGIRNNSNRTQGAAFESQFPADNSIQPHARICGGGIAAVTTAQISRLYQQGRAFLGMAGTAQVHEDQPAEDIENQFHVGATAPRSAIDQALHELSEDFIKEEQRAIDPALKAAFAALQKSMNDTRDYSNMPQARSLLLQMHGLKQDDVERGFKRGGAVYSYRNVVGSAIAFLPLIITAIKAKPEHKKDLAFQLKMSAGYFASVILASCAGVACNARTLLHCTPIQDAEFDGSPYVSKELMSVNTPSYPKIQQELEESLEKAIALSTALDLVVNNEAGLTDADKKNVCIRMIEGAEKSDKNDLGVKHYLARAQLHRAYIEGIQLQAGFQTTKVFGNLAAGWAAFLKKDPKLGIYVQLGVGVGQIFAQRAVAPADQKKLQYALLELETMSRPLAGNNAQTDDQEIRKMIRTPREVRVFNLESLTTSYVTVLAQQIGDLLGMSAVDYESYRRLKMRKQNSEELAGLQTRVDQGYENLTAEERFGSLARPAIQAPQLSEPGFSGCLFSEIAELTSSSRDDIIRLIELRRRDNDGKIAEDNRIKLDVLQIALGEKFCALPELGQLALSGNEKLKRAFQLATCRRSSQNAGFASELAAATFGTLSGRFSDEEILAEVIQEIAVQQPLAWLRASTANNDGVDPSQPVDGDSNSQLPSEGPDGLQPEQIHTVFPTCQNFTGDQFNELMRLMQTAKRSTLSPEQIATMQELTTRFDEAYKNLDSENIFTIWGVEGLDSDLVLATRSKNYDKENPLCATIAAKLGMNYERYQRFHALRMLCLDQHMSPLDESENLKLQDFERVRRTGFEALGGALSKIHALEKEYADIEHDPQNIIERRFDKVSDQHKKLVLDGMQVTRGESLFTLKTETGMLLKEGNRRAGNAPEYMAAYSAGMWRAFQLGVTGVNGPLIMTALVTLLEQMYRSTLKDPHSFQSPIWTKGITTAISMAALAANILAAHRIAEAKASPLSWNLHLQKFLGGTGSIAETKLQIAKLDIRTKFKETVTSLGSKKFVEIGASRIATKYFWDTLRAGAEIKNGLAVLICGGREALATHKAYDSRRAKIRLDGEKRQQIKAQLDAPPS